MPRGTIMGDTNTARDPSLLREAVPNSLIVLRRILAYSKSTAATCKYVWKYVRAKVRAIFILEREIFFDADYFLALVDHEAKMKKK